MKLVIGLTVLSLASACKKHHNDPAATVPVDLSGALTKEELSAPASISPMTQAALVDEFVAADYLAPVASASVVSCLKKLLETSSIEASGNMVTLNKTIDTSSCYIELLNGLGGIGTQVNASASFHSVIECSGVDVGIYNGKKPNEFDANAVCVNGYKHLEHSRSKSTATSMVSGKPVDIKYSDLSAKSDSNNEMCVVTSANGVFSETGCVEIEKAQDVGAEPYSDYTKRQHKDLSWTLQSTSAWYASGSMDLFINNWTGKISYSGFDKPPTFTMTDGKDTIDGNFGLPLLGRLPRMNNLRSFQTQIRDLVKR